VRHILLAAAGGEAAAAATTVMVALVMLSILSLSAPLGRTVALLFAVLGGSARSASRTGCDERLGKFLELPGPRASLLLIGRLAPTVQAMTNIGRSEVARCASAGLLVLMVGCGAVVVGAGGGALAPDTTATDAMSGEAPTSLVAPNGPSCIIGLNCGCIHSCGPVPHHAPPPGGDHTHDAPAGPGPGDGR
jgi:hypothetical protein